MATAVVFVCWFIPDLVKLGKSRSIKMETNQDKQSFLSWNSPGDLVKTASTLTSLRAWDACTIIDCDVLERGWIYLDKESSGKGGWHRLGTDVIFYSARQNVSIKQVYGSAFLWVSLFGVCTIWHPPSIIMEGSILLPTSLWAPFIFIYNTLLRLI